ncbi:multidrug ABC transporter permease [Candidatus Saccharibacteria bacterium RIFCSPHIGHO2_12_FULL_48_21]|nr:MAG: multidrug ABC transporter permease [Candidatus Saccharibacteria bacterium RIFCSPHIGHO2_12_FULL_48_21]
MQVFTVLWLRQMRRYVRSRSRVLGAIGQPLLFLLALGYGLGSVYKQAGAGNYLEFLVPGIIVQTILFSAVFWGMIILFDRRFGFLAELLVAPVSRLRILLGSTSGGATIALIQAIMLFVASIAIGFRPVDWAALPLAFLIMALLSLALAFVGAGIASTVEDFQGFQAINNFVVFPAFFLSSALYPLTAAPPILKLIATLNPISYAVDGLRHVLIGQGHFLLALDVAVMIATLVFGMVFAVNRFNRIQM